ncbi:heme/hemin ABC transporter substrate-binding protein [Nitrincola sp. A-D6]|uniref:heme/hemin ABC transporter substrate-binding protein n=1 Tax=Nitrincola sp. A-D6 TaxID=1545442 RepID=UPI00068D938F|nr:helical backbone metal receptor [Nitrincola sp. A-D6]
MPVNLRRIGCSVVFFLSVGMASLAVAEPQRVISVDGSITEIIYALRQQHRLVGRDTTSTWPEEVKALPDVGYMRQLSAEGLLSLRPDLILVTADAKPESVLNQLQQAGVNIRVIPNSYSVSGVEYKIAEVADALGVSREGDALIQKFSDETDRVISRLRANHSKQVRAIFVMGVRNSSMMVAGKGSRADAFLRLAGLINPFSDSVENYQTVSAEALIEANPDLILTLENAEVMGGGRDRVLADPAISRTQAGQAGSVMVIDPRWLNFGPELPESLNTLVNSLAPENSVGLAGSGEQN